jgi:hypothetical protein
VSQQRTNNVHTWSAPRPPSSKGQPAQTTAADTHVATKQCAAFIAQRTALMQCTLTCVARRKHYVTRHATVISTTNINIQSVQQAQHTPHALLGQQVTCGFEPLEQCELHTTAVTPSSAPHTLAGCCRRQCSTLCTVCTELQLLLMLPSNSTYQTFSLHVRW